MTGHANDFCVIFPLHENLGQIWIAMLKWFEKSTHYEEKGRGGVVKRVEISVGLWCPAVGGILKVAGQCANQGAFLSGSKVARRWNLILSGPIACPLTSRPDQAPLNCAQRRALENFHHFRDTTKLLPENFHRVRDTACEVILDVAPGKPT